MGVAAPAVPVQIFSQFEILLYSYGLKSSVSAVPKIFVYFLCFGELIMNKYVTVSSITKVSIFDFN
jgi:hypothetical protein